MHTLYYYYLLANLMSFLDPLNIVSEEQFSPSLWPTLDFAKNVFDSLKSVQDKKDLIREITRVVAAKQAKNLKHILPPPIGLKNKGQPKGTKRRDILHEIIAAKEVKKAKIEKKEEEKKKKENERYYHFTVVFTII